MLIDCDTCAVREIHCGDCVVSVLLSRPPQGVELDGDEQTALAALAEGGLVPPLRLVPSSPTDPRPVPGVRRASRAGDVGEVRHVAG